ncbi:MAG TPA: hypothetical protein VJB94_01505 [Candidatus Nanoarchaeia archaeon]|nr:hypothetical protein [Candidatus Nanoarchaeia archaeon]
MKKRLLLLLFLLLIPSVDALISLDGPDKQVYNLGDKVIVKGYVTEDHDLYGLFNLFFDCENDLQVLVRFLSLKQNEKEEFSESLPVPFFLGSECSIKATLVVNNTVVEEVKTPIFKITKELKGNFDVKTGRLQVGKQLELSGNVFRLDGTNVDGSATIYLMQSGVPFFVDSAPVTKGTIVYIHDTSQNPAGEYNVDVEVFDDRGNQYKFVSASNFTLIDIISVSADTSKQKVYPGDEIEVFGIAKTITGEDVSEADVYISFVGFTYKTVMKRGKFSNTIEIPEDIKAGDHPIKIEVKDYVGNIGSTEIKINALVVPKTLDLTVEGDNLLPEESLTLTPLLVDQAGDAINEEVSIEVFDSDDNKIFQDVAVTNSVLSFVLPKQSRPGNWRIVSFASGFKVEKTFYVRELSKLDYALQDHYLYVTNVGNVPYNSPLKVTLKGFGQETNIVKKLNMDVNETETIDLAESELSGTFTVYVGDKSFDNVVLTGPAKTTFNFDIVYYIIVLAIIAVVVYLIATSRRRLIQKIRESRQSQHPSHENLSDDEIRRKIDRDLEKNRINYERRSREEDNAGSFNRPGSYSKDTIFGRKRSKLKKDDGKEPGSGLFDMF